MRRERKQHLTTVAQIASCALALVLAGVLVNLFVAHGWGDAQGWSHWRDEHASALLIWRLSLYGALIYGWCWMRARLLQLQPEATRRLRRAEWTGIAALVWLELSNALAGLEVPWR